MMYKMIIVDDEKIIREGLKKYITKYCKDFIVEEIFADGQESLDFLDKNSVDLVLTDIKMPKVSGMELCEKIKQKNPNVQIIILSGYDDFSYAQQAIRFDVLSYLLKPIDNNELLKELGRAAERIKRINENSKLKERNEELTESIREKFFIDILFGVKKDYSEEDFEKLGIDADFENVRCSVCNISCSKNSVARQWKYGKDGIKTMINNYFFTEREGIIYHSWIEDDIILVLHKFADFDEYAKKMLSWMKENMESVIEIKTEFECSGICGLKEYMQKRRNFDNNYVKNERYILLNTYMRLNMFNEAKLLYDDLTDEIIKTEKENAVDEIKKLFALFEDVEKFKWNDISEKDILKISDARFDSVMAHMKNKHMREADIIKKIKEYISVNYANDITLDDIGSMVYMNSVYLSRYFKEQTGQNFRDYLLNVRMVNAERLIKENKYKIYEISDMVGYKSSRHFSKQFKQFTGYMPKEYGKKVWRVTVNDEE